MPRPADKVVSPAELRFKPANSNDAARAVFSPHFIDVPRCSFAKDDGISHYLIAETEIDASPVSPDIEAPANVDVPAIQSETPESDCSGRRKLLRGGFALSIFLHTAAAIVLGCATLSLPDEPPLEDGALSVTVFTEGNAEADARAAGAEEEVTEEDEAKPVETTLPKPAVEETAVAASSQQVLSDVPLPVLGADLPEILTTQTESKVETEVAAKTPIEDRIEKPLEKPRAAEILEKPIEMKLEKKPVVKQEEPKKQPDKPQPRDKKRQNRGDRGNQAANARRGDVDAKDKGKTSTNSRGDSANRNIGNAARTNYRGLVNRKLARAKGRMQNPAKGNVRVTFTILANGAISDLHIKDSSGKVALDEAAMKIVRNASPFPPIPAEVGKKDWEMTVSMTFTGK